jgi:hypothetical protein
VDETGRYLFGAFYGGHVISLNMIGADRDVAAEPLQVIPVGCNAHSIRTDGSNCFIYEAPRHRPDFPVQLRRQSGPALITHAGGVTEAVCRAAPLYPLEGLQIPVRLERAAGKSTATWASVPT